MADSERIVIRHEDKNYFVRPPNEQRVLSGVLTDDEDLNGYVFPVFKGKGKETRKVIEELHGVLNNPKKAITDRKVVTMTIDLESLLQPVIEVIGPSKLTITSDF